MRVINCPAYNKPDRPLRPGITEFVKNKSTEYYSECHIFIRWLSLTLFIISFCSYRLRIEAMLLKEEFSNTVDWIRPCLDAVILTARG